MLSGRYERLSLIVSAVMHVLVLSAFVLAGVGGGAEKGVLMVDVVYLDGTAGKDDNAPGLETPQAPRKMKPVSAKRAENPPAKSNALAAAPRHEMKVPPEDFFQERDESGDVSSVMAPEVSDVLAAAHDREASIGEPPARGFTASETPKSVEAPPASGVPGAPGLEEARAAVLHSIRDSIQRALSYPLLARKRGMEGTVVAAFAIGRDGTPVRVRVLRSSGHGMLDREVMRTISKASPYPSLEGEVEVPVSFRLKEE